MARDVPGATRPALYAFDPDLISLVWPSKCDGMGPRDLALDEHPELHPYFDPDITLPLVEAHIESMLTPLPPPAKGRVGVIQPLAVAVLEPNAEGIFEPMINRPGTWYVACDGRTRTRESREANSRIRAAGGDDSEIIRVRFEIKPVDGTGAMLIRDIAQRCRKTESPLAQARRAANHIDQGTPKHIVLLAMGLKSWGQVENYAKLLELDEKLQTLVNSHQMPMSEALAIGRSSKPAEQKEVAAKLERVIQAKQSERPKDDSAPAKLSSREVAAVVEGQSVSKVKPMRPLQIRQWTKVLQTDKTDVARLTLAVLNTIQGTGSMEEYPDVAPPSATNKKRSKV